jgi:hypothetical protein
MEAKGILVAAGKEELLPQLKGTTDLQAPE